MDQYIQMSRANWRTQLAQYGRFLLRWGWFVVLLIILTTTITKFIPDAASSTVYEASLQVQIALPSGSGVIAQNNAGTFFASLMSSPSTLSLAVSSLDKLPAFKGLQLSGLQSLVTVTPVTQANVIQLNAIAASPEDATKMANIVYQSFLQTVHKERSAVVDGLHASLVSEQQQVEKDLGNLTTQLQQLSLQGRTSTPQYRYFSDLQVEEKQLAGTINANLLALEQQGFVGNQDILQLVKPQPNITTIPATPGTQGQRLTLAPIIGLLMGLAGALLANNFSNSLPLRGKKREMVLPHITAIFPVIPEKRNRLAALQQVSAQCQPILLHLRYQAAEYEKRLKLITVTSPRGGEGKSTIAASFAIACAQSGFRTLLVDANPHKPVLHTWFQVPNTNGTLDSVRSLINGTIGPSPIVSSPITNLGLLPSGNANPNRKASTIEEPLPVDGLRSFTALLTKQADIIIFDSSSLLRDVEAIDLASLSDIVLMVVDAKKSKSSDVLEAETLLSDLGLPYATVLNRAKRELLD